MRSGTGRQVFNSILHDLSGKNISDEGLHEASEKLRAGLLLLGSTPEEHFGLVDRIKWGSSYYEEYEEDFPNQVSRQGIALVNGDYFLSDIIENILDDKVIKKRVMSIYPALDNEDYEAMALAIWLLTISIQMFEQLQSVEKEEDLGLDEWVDIYKKKIDYYRKF